MSRPSECAVRNGEIAKKRAEGRTMQSLADEYGLSKNRIFQICRKKNVSYFRKFTRDRCVYVILRDYLNDNQISIPEMCKLMGYEPSAGTHNKYAQILRGKGKSLNKVIIDKMIAFTGLTYEELFERDDIQNEQC